MLQSPFPIKPTVSVTSQERTFFLATSQSNNYYCCQSSVPREERVFAGVGLTMSGLPVIAPPTCSWNQSSELYNPARELNGALGVDVKHGFYNRYLRRIKASAVRKNRSQLQQQQNQQQYNKCQNLTFVPAALGRIALQQPTMPTVTVCDCQTSLNQKYKSMDGSNNALTL